jgi:hypothetical protein
MIWTLLPFGLATILVTGILVSSSVAYKFIRIFKGRLTGEATQEKCLEGSDSFAIAAERGKMPFRRPEAAR